MDTARPGDEPVGDARREAAHQVLDLDHRLHAPGRLHQERDLLLERYVERVLAHRGVPRAGRRLDLGEAHALRQPARGRERHVLELVRRVRPAFHVLTALLGMVIGGTAGGTVMSQQCSENCGVKAFYGAIGGSSARINVPW